MSLYKKCPACGTDNDPRNMECIECSYDLIGVPVTDTEVAAVEEPEEPASETPAADEPSGGSAQGNSVTEPAQLVRICSCGEMNPPQLRKCQSCHEDISDILPVPRPVPQVQNFVLEEIGTKRLFPVPKGTTVIGRESSMSEILADKPYVSRIHAKITQQDGKFFIENLSHTNFTYVNNEKIPEGRVELKTGDEIGLGGRMVGNNRQSQAAYLLVGVQ